MTRTPLVLLVSGDEWETRSLTSVLAPEGYAVLRAYGPEQAVRRAAAADPDAFFVSARVGDTDGADLCRRFLDEGVAHPSAPILLLAPVQLGRQERLAALKAGAWDVVHPPVDPEELLLRLERLLQGRLAQGDRTAQGSR
jgi:DNA-binding response OmpR family regulator